MTGLGSGVEGLGLVAERRVNGSYTQLVANVWLAFSRALQAPSLECLNSLAASALSSHSLLKLPKIFPASAIPQGPRQQLLTLQLPKPKIPKP